MKSFFFQKFEVKQSANVFRVGTDAVLLGALCATENCENILEIGTGCGIISLMIAQRNAKTHILAIDIDENAVLLAKENFKNSIFEERLTVKMTDFNLFTPKILFDLIVCNPPYFEVNSSQKEVIARQKITLNFKDLIKKSTKILTIEGILSVIIPAEDCENFITLAESFQLNLIRKISILGIKNGNIKRNILEFSSSTKALVEEDFIIEKNPRKYSEQYLDATKAFHIFK